MSKKPEWIKIDPKKPEEIPDVDVWVYIPELDLVKLYPNHEFIPLGIVTHYMVIEKPEPPKD